MPVEFTYGAAELIFAAFTIAATVIATVVSMATVVAYFLTREESMETAVAASPVITAEPVRRREMRAAMAG